MFLDAALGWAVVSAPMLGNGRNFKKGTSYVRSFYDKRGPSSFHRPSSSRNGGRQAAAPEQNGGPRRKIWWPAPRAPLGAASVAGLPAIADRETQRAVMHAFGYVEPGEEEVILSTHEHL